MLAFFKMHHFYDNFFLLCSPACHPRLILDDAIEEKELRVEEEARGEAGACCGFLSV